jgi:DNA invertase Pin-like site-specific DNA recombinase
MKQKNTKASIEAANITNKAIIFARVSTTEQEQGHSLEAQIAKLHDYAKKNNLNVLKVFDVTESSTRGDRPEFHKMIAFVNAQKGQTALICDKVDRLQRGFSELPILDKLRKLLIVHIIKEHFKLKRLELKRNINNAVFTNSIPCFFQITFTQ